MVAAQNDLLPSVSHVSLDPADAFNGEWLLDRVSGLVDCAIAEIQRLRIDAQTLHIELKRDDESARIVLTAELNGEAAEVNVAGERLSMQALLEADALIWEFEHQRASGRTRVRRVMRSSAQRSQLIAERVDMNADGVPIALRTEYWTRVVGRSETVPDGAATAEQ